MPEVGKMGKWEQDVHLKLIIIRWLSFIGFGFGEHLVGKLRRLGRSSLPANVIVSGNWGLNAPAYDWTLCLN